VLTEEQIRRLRSYREAEFGRGATPREIELAAEQLGVELPGSYKAFLGHFAGTSFEGLELYGLGGDVPAYLDLVDVTLGERTQVRPRLPSRLIPLTNDGAGNHYCLDVAPRRARRMPGSFLGSQLGGISRPGVPGAQP
jgi:cell wall assembly regulator SMI1